ncbi:hypothetical protein I4F81_010192 [Pyropia yezoensis]|uniref:Uncharacterized protein n=1 Tax=Pyropia yezoensis TaxID=2788 RepID=A0ACC3CD21_PYRYE|nr:hypothetical protein I4F81_010192 [Neopyropia yezoensis]
MHPHACEYLVVLDVETTAGDGVGGAGEVVEWPYAVVHLPSAAVVEARGLPLGPSLHVFLTHLSRLLPAPATYVLATDGPWDLSVVLPREAHAKRLTLPSSLTTFFDLRTEFCRALPHAGRPHNRATLLAALHLPPPPPMAPASAIAHVRSLASVVVRLLAAGHHFVSPMLPPSIFAPVVAAGVPAADIVRLRGLPWSATEADVLAFFSSVPAAPGGVRFVRNAAGKATGEAFLQVPPGGMDRALRRHRHMMGPRCGGEPGGWAAWRRRWLRRHSGCVW